MSIIESMATQFGLSSTGFVPERFSDVQSELTAAFQSAFGNSLQTQGTSVMGQIIGIIAQSLADLWDASQLTYSGSFASTATGSALDAIFLARGITRNPATFSQVTLTLTGTNGTVIPVNSSVQDNVLGTLWYTTSAATISGTTATVSAQPANTGGFQAAIGALTIINSPVSGWTGVTNATAALPGTNVESDGAFRQRGLQAYSGGSSCSVDGLRAAILSINGVEQCIVAENSTGSTDAYGRPPKSIEVIVEAQNSVTSSTVAQAIWQNKPAGIALCNSTGASTTSGTTVDSLGVTRTLTYTIPTNTQIYVLTTYHKLSGAPGDIQTQLVGTAGTGVPGQPSYVPASGILGYFAGLSMGQEASSWAMQQYISNTVPAASTLDYLGINIGLSANPSTSSPVVINSTQLAVCQSSNIAFLSQN